jgi:NAD(P)-dependent dehydrogenase (short-subunit alcohol dehydrogenase family)
MTQTVVITGGSKGIGLHTAKRFALNGWNIGICARTPNDLDSAKIDIESEFNVKVFGYIADVASESDMEHFAYQTNQRLGNIDVLICNAAVLGPIGHFSSINLSEIESTLSINVLGPYNSIRAFWPYLSRSLSARIIIISGGGLGGPKQIRSAPAYVPTKAAIALLTEILADDLKSINGSIIAIAPGGVIATEFLKTVLVAGVEAAGEALFIDAKHQQEADIGTSLDEFHLLLDFLMTDAGLALNGRILSAKWNKVDDLKEELIQGLGPDIYRLRRIDNHLYKSIE